MRGQNGSGCSNGQYGSTKQYGLEHMFQSLPIKFSENQGVWACPVVNEKGKYFLEKPAAMPCGHAARRSQLP